MANEGTDLVRTALASYTLASSTSRTLPARQLRPALTGNSLDNAIAGGAGNDTLDGGAGNDTLIGGRGNDIYIVDSAGDTITEAATRAPTVRTRSSYAWPRPATSRSSPARRRLAGRTGNSPITP